MKLDYMDKNTEFQDPQTLAAMNKTGKLLRKIEDESKKQKKQEIAIYSIAAVLAVILIVIFSASLFIGIDSEDSADKITGGVASIKCTETDNGKDYYMKGSTKIAAVTAEDKCEDNMLTEYYCESGSLKAIKYNCEFSCKDGACTKK